jgi:hypothetical protein
LRHDEVAIGVTTAYPGTGFFEASGVPAKGLDWSQAPAFKPSTAVHASASLKCTDLHAEQIRQVFHKAMRAAVLINPRLVFRRLSNLRSVRHLGQSLSAVVRLVTD